MVTREEIREAAIDDVIKQDKNVHLSEEGLIKKVHADFVQKQVQFFPKYCRHAYEVNKVNSKEQEDYGIKGKFTESYGWSKDRTMQHKWVVPMDLKLFMQNLVYWKFWDDDNAKVRDSFMNDICRGGTAFDYQQLLKKVVLYYGTDLKNTL